MRDGRSGLLPRPTAAFLGSLRGLKLVPSKRRCLVPPTGGQRQPLGSFSFTMGKVDFDIL